MTSFTTKSLRLALLIAASGLGPGAAQAQAPAGAYREDPGTALSRHLRSLSDEPRSLTSLMGAGNAALELGDPQAAATFFARAEEIAPRDGRIKAGIGSAFVQMEQAPAALKFFGEATALGVPDAEIARDRGLAYDLSGNPARAQLDYALVLRKGDDPEVRRRMALSMAIGGDRDGALKMIDAQLRQQDRAAWRTRAFVLALTGDAAGATKAAEAVMPAQASAMRPFFAKLPSLGPAERAMAVHFGHFPGDGRPVQMAGNVDNGQYASIGPAGTASANSGGNAPVRPRTTPPETASTAARRRLGTEDDAATRASSTQRMITASPAPRASRPQVTAQVQAVTGSPAGSAKQPAASTQSTATPPATGQATTTASTPALTKPAATAALNAAPSSAAAGPPAVASSSIKTAELPKSSITPPEPAKPSSFADVAATIAALPASVKPEAASSDKPVASAGASASAEGAPAKPAAKAPPAAAKKETAKKPAEQKKAEEKKPEPKHPSRHWVQIAGSADEDGLAREFTRLKGKAPKLFAGQSGWTTPLKATNRLLVGPFKTEKDAQDFVNELAKADLSAFSWTSPAGQEIEKLAAK